MTTINKNNYFVRVGIRYVNQFFEYCQRLDLKYNFMFTGIGIYSKESELYTIEMTHKDAMTLILAIPVNIIKIEGE